MKAFLILSCLFFVQTTQATVLYANPNEKLVYFHPTPFLNLRLEEVPGQATATLSVTMNYGSNAIQNEFNYLVTSYKGWDVKITPAKNTTTTFTLDLPTVGIHKDLRLSQTNMGPFVKDKITLNPIEKIRFQTTKAAIEASIHKLTLSTTYLALVETEKFESDAEFCSQIEVTQVKDLISVIGKIEKPVAIQHEDTFISLKKSVPENCFELENSEVNSFAELMQSKVLLKPGGIARGSRFEKKPQEQLFEVQPIVYVTEEETPEE